MKGILFTPAMAAAACRVINPKWQTRRVMDQPSETHETMDRTSYRMDPELKVHEGTTYADFVYTMGEHEAIPCDYKVGERRCLLTTWATEKRLDHLKPTELCAVHLWHAGEGTPKPDWAGKSRPGRFLPNHLRPLMPMFDVLTVRAERVQDISEADAIAEGIEGNFKNFAGAWKNYLFKTPHPRFPIVPTDKQHRLLGYRDPRKSFESLWDSINEARGFGWSANPWIWTISFRRI